MSFPACAIAPESGERTPILIGAWVWASAGAGPAATRRARAPIRITSMRIDGAPFRAGARDSLPPTPQLGYMSGMRVALLLTAVVGLGALSIDMFLPSL